MDLHIVFMMLGLCYSIGYTVRGYAEYEIVCDCNKMIPIQVVYNINNKILEDNIRLKKELHIAIDYINYTNIGNTYYDISKKISAEADNSMIDIFADYDELIKWFFHLKMNTYNSMMDLIDSKKILYKQYIELKNRCYRY